MLLLNIYIFYQHFVGELSDRLHQQRAFHFSANLFQNGISLFSNLTLFKIPDRKFNLICIMYRHMRFVSMLLANFACLLQLVQVASISEVDRVRIFHSKYSWPPVEHFENEAYKTYAAGLEKEIMDIKGGDERWVRSN